MIKAVSHSYLFLMSYVKQRGLKMSKTDFTVKPKKQKRNQEPSPQIHHEMPEVDIQKHRREPEVVKSIKMAESLSKKLKYYALLSGKTETSIVSNLLTKHLEDIQLPKEMI